jgi:hypothetical protein
VKRKPTSEPGLQPILDAGIVDLSAVAAPTAFRPVAKLKKCEICSEPCSPNTTDALCWVCRRLKLSAWRDTDVQMPAQE